MDRHIPERVYSAGKSGDSWPFVIGIYSPDARSLPGITSNRNQGGCFSGSSFSFHFLFGIWLTTHRSYDWFSRRSFFFPSFFLCNAQVPVRKEKKEKGPFCFGGFERREAQKSNRSMMRQNRWIGANEREENHLTFCVCRPHQTTRRPSLAVFFSSKSSNGNCLQHIKTRERESGRQQKTNNGRENKIITKHFLSFYYLAAFQLWIIIAFLLLFFSFINSVNKERNFFFLFNHFRFFFIS
jgi:hypothetical protein